MTREDFRKVLADKILSGEIDFDTDNTGQMIVYTGYYAQVQSEEILETPDPHWDDDFPVAW